MDYELEDRQAELGAQSSLQMAYSESQIGLDRSDDEDKIAEATAAGKFCVVWNQEHFCRITDAFIACTTHLEHVAETAEEAERWIIEKFGEPVPSPVGIRSPRPKTEPVPPEWQGGNPDDKEIPF